MKTIEQWEQSAYDIHCQREYDKHCQNELDKSIPIHQKVGTVIPFSKTVDRDPNPRIPLSVPVPYVSISKREALFWVVLVAVWLGYLFFGPGER